MAKVIFYEKTGCINNTKQKVILKEAGHQVEAIDLIQYEWKKEELLAFFEGLDVADWFNKNAPSITTGIIDPKDFDKESAIEAMLEDHLLIKRPLIIYKNHKIVGFDKGKLHSLIGLGTNFLSVLHKNLEDCPKKEIGSRCD